MDHFTETTTTSLGSNLANSFKGIFFGLIFIVGSVILIWWNESRSVNLSNALHQMQEEIVTLPNTTYDVGFEKKLVYIQSEVKPSSKINDSLFGVTCDALKLKRIVKMYQWKENTSTTEEKKLGGSTEKITTYDYEKEWFSRGIDSASFKHPLDHKNPPMQYKGQTFTADAKMGDYQISAGLISKIGATKSLDNLSKVDNNHGNFLYLGDDPQNPKVGDVKITYLQAKSGVYSVVAKLENRSFGNYEIDDRELGFIRAGKVSADEIFEDELSSNTVLTWVLRVVGLLVMFFGFIFIMSLLVTLANVVPFLGTILGGATALVAGLLTFVLGSVVIAFAWLGARPILALGIIVGGIAIAFVMGKFGNKKQTPPVRKSALPPQRK